MFTFNLSSFSVVYSKVIFTCIFTMVLSLSINAQVTNAINDDPTFNRKGLFLSIGLGGGMVQQKITYDDVQSESNNFLSLLGDITVGLGINEKVMGILTLKQNRYTIEDETDKMKTSFEFVGIGGAYYLKSTANAPFLSAGVGIASQVIDLDQNLGMNGLGIFLGGGYFVNEHLHLKADIIWGNPNIVVFDERLSFNTLTLGVSVNYSF